jgi:hypothetical protein
MAQERKVRRQALYATTAGEVTEIGLRVSPDGRVQFVTDVVDTRVETSYERPKGPKVIERIRLEADRLHINPDVATFTNFDRVFAVDTNTRDIHGVSISVTAVTEIVPPKPCGHGTIQLIFLHEFMQVTAKRERVGWLSAALDLVRAEKYRALSRIGIVVDSELNDLPAYNARTLPLLTGVLGRDHFLPQPATLIFATSDKRDYIVNKAIRSADDCSRRLLDALEQGAVEPNTRRVPPGRPYVAFRRFTVDGWGPNAVAHLRAAAT